MRSICLYFQVHQPVRLKTYRFFDIGYNHYYYNDFENKTILNRVADHSYLPMNKILADLIKQFGSKFKVTFSLTGVVLEQMERYAPHVIKSFQELAKTGCVEFMAETNAHSLVSLKDKHEFKVQVEKHAKKIESLFGQKPTTFRNTALIYSDEIGEMVYEMGYSLMVTEGAKHILGWKSPNYLYRNATNPKLRLLLKNFQLSDDIAFRFSNQAWSEWPLTSEKFVNWINTVPQNEEVINLFMDYCVFGEHHAAETGIFEFIKALPKRVFESSNFVFSTPAEVAKNIQPISPVYVPYPISWADEERDLTAWLGNELQTEAFEKLYYLADKIKKCSDPFIIKDWEALQSSDHFYYMSTKWFSDGAIHHYFNPFSSPYEAFINYMNILSDFEIRVYRDCMQKHQIEDDEDVKAKPEVADKQAKESKPSKPKASKPAAKKVRKSTFKLQPIKFTQIADLPNSNIKDIAAQVDIQILAHALKGAKQEMKEKFFANIGKRAAKRLEELLSDSSAITRAQTASARKVIENISRKLLM